VASQPARRPGNVTSDSAGLNEIETVSAGLAAATARLNDLQLTERPLRITKKMVDDTIEQFNGILERAPLDTRVATEKELFERVDVAAESSRRWPYGP
jgi:hypothetical protein